MSNVSIMDLIMPLKDDSGQCKIPCSFHSRSGGGLFPLTGQILTGLIYTEMSHYDSFVLQSAVSIASRGKDALVVVGGER